jgi:histidinol-phosphate aminotransferase
VMIPAKQHLKSLERIRNPAARSGYLRLDKNEGIAGFDREFVARLREEITEDFLTTYPDVSSLYQKLARWLGCRQENIYITAGSDAAIKAAFEVFVEPGDTVALLSPTYAMTYVYIQMFRAKPVEIHYREDLSLSGEVVLQTLRENRPKLLFIPNPNSPTGTVIEQEDLRKIIEVAAEQATIALIDEAYYLFYPESAIDMINQYPGLVVTRTFSKAFGLASARLGFAAAHEKTIGFLEKVRPMYETNAFAARFAEMVLDSPEIIEKNVREVMNGKQFLESELDKLGIPHHKSYTNFILIDVGSFARSVRIGEELRRKRILIKSGFKEDLLSKCIRVTIGNQEQMALFLKEFQEVYYATEIKK